MKINFSFKQFIVPNFWAKLAFMISAIIMMGVTLSVLIEIGWGTDPASFMNLNVAHLFGWSLGNTQVFDYGILFVFTVIFGAQMIGFGTLANMFLIGYIADFCRWIWALTGFHEFILGASLPVLVVIFAATLLAFVVFASIYMNAELGMAPYDALPQIISNGLPKIPFFIIRIIFDFSAIGIGIIAAMVKGDGIQGSVFGSACMSLLLGPVITIVGRFMKRVIPVFRDGEGENS